MTNTPRPLAVGDLIQDNDPRMPERVREVMELRDDIAVASYPGMPAGPRTAIRLDRIKLDGKPRRSGWNRIERP